MAAQAFHLGRQFSIIGRDSLNLVEAPLSVLCGLHQVLYINKLSQTVRLNGRIKWSSQTYLDFCHQTFCRSFNFRVSSTSGISSCITHSSFRRRDTYTCCRLSWGWPRISSTSSSLASCLGGGAGLEFVVSATTMAFPRAAASVSVLYATSGCCSSAWSSSLGAKVSTSAGLVLEKGALVPQNPA